MSYQHSTPTPVLERPRVHLAAWTIAVLTFGVVDVASTIYFVATTPAVESHPLVAAAIEATGLWILIPWKAAAFGLFYAAYRIVPQSWAVGVPIGLALIGSVVSVWNLRLGLQAAGL